MVRPPEYRLRSLLRHLLGYKCDGPPLPLSTSPTTTLQTNPWFHGKTPQIEGYMDPGVTLCLMEFTGNSKLEWLYFQPFL